MIPATAMPRSLRSRLLVSALIWAVLALVVAGGVLGLAFRDSIERSHTLRLIATLHTLAGNLEVAEDGTVSLSHPMGDPRFDQPYSGWYWQIADSAGFMLRSRSLWDFSLPLHPAAANGGLHIEPVDGPNGHALILVERDLRFPNHAEPLHVTVAASRYDIDREVRRFDLLLAASFCGLALALAIALRVQVGYGLRPLRRLTSELECMSRQPQHRLGEGYPKEIAPLAEALNKVLDHNTRLVERSRTHLGNLAHGLKTPLAILRAELSSSSASKDEMDRQIVKMSRMIEHHLARARAEATSAQALGAHAAVIDVVRELVPMFNKIHADRHIRFERHIDAAAVFVGGHDELAEMIGNLLDNAGKWAATRVVVTAAVQDRYVTIAVEDDGPGMTEEECTTATRRGVRLDENTPGSGLGLSITADLAHVHGGTLLLDRSTSHGGLRARLSFPAP